MSRNQFNVVYIDFPITQTVLKWLKSFDQDNILFLLNNDNMVCDSFEELTKFAMLIVSNKDIRLMEQFEDKNTTFYLTFNDTYTQDIL